MHLIWDKTAIMTLQIFQVLKQPLSLVFLSEFPKNSQVQTATTGPPLSWAGVSRPEFPAAASRRLDFTVFRKSRLKK